MKQKLPMVKNLDKVFRVFRKNYKKIPLENIKNDAYKILVSTLLSSRTRDELTFFASEKLFRKAPDIKSLNKLKVREIRDLIYPVGFYKTKARNLKKLSKIICKNYNCKIPTTRKKLLNLPGVGRKTANLVLAKAFHIPAISVDTHVHKITNLLGWVNTKTPEQTEKQLVKILPPNYWLEINRLFVSIGRQFPSRKKLEEFLKKEKLI